MAITVSENVGRKHIRALSEQGPNSLMLIRTQSKPIRSQSESNPKAIRKLPESYPKATRKLPESYPKATRKLPDIIH
ncbi:hypothetical protein BC936DRAFT_143829 [Jimgerdemannia flammicorona]|uniref:Uncharacterized protein n=1 Tax=Jimgerdemannia flammicorona TaxID=994334 RepID=A0A433DDF4_9FUNG|nr:hypothetical protein BC936DRAFT_143829 [Jimgerdemannia flammicorona]